MGKWAQVAFTKSDKSVEANRGYLRTHNGRRWIGAYHPTYAFFHNPYEWGSFTVDLGRFSRLIHGNLTPDVPLVLRGGDLKELKAIYRWALTRGYVSVDLETHPAKGDEVGFTAKDPMRAGINLLSVGVPNAGLSVRWSLLTKQAKQLLKKMMADPRLAKVGQNIRWFDEHILRRHGLPLKGRIVDVRDMRRAVSTTSKLSLHYMGSIYLDTSPWKEFGTDDAKA